jgi:hypothetical protein
MTANELATLVGAYPILTIIVERSQSRVRSLLDAAGWGRGESIGPFELRHRP